MANSFEVVMRNPSPAVVYPLLDGNIPDVVQELDFSHVIYALHDEDDETIVGVTLWNHKERRHQNAYIGQYIILEDWTIRPISYSELHEKYVVV